MNNQNVPLTLNSHLVLRENRDKIYSVYDIIEGVRYTISHNAYIFLKILRSNPYTINQLIEFSDYHHLPSKELLLFIQSSIDSDWLIPAEQASLHKVTYLDHKTKKDLKDLTEYSPYKIDLFITKYCNLSCRHCFENSSPNYMHPFFDLNKMEALFLEMQRMNIETLKITGGEALSVKQSKDVVRLLKGKPIECIILTNGTLLDDEWIEIVKEQHIKLGISLDGKDAETHDYLRGKGIFDRVYRNMCKLREAGCRFSTTCCINGKNVNQIEEMAKRMIEDFNVRKLYINKINPIGRAAQHNTLQITETEYKKLHQQLINLQSTYPNRILVTDDAQLSSTVSDTKSNQIRCAAGNKSLVVDYDMNVYPCIYAVGFDNYKLGNYPVNSIEEIWYSDKLALFRGKVTLSDLTECRDCSLNALCNLKNCRLKPVYEGKSFYSAVTFCKKNTHA